VYNLRNGLSNKGGTLNGVVNNCNCCISTNYL
jgi:hypothetical protein